MDQILLLFMIIIILLHKVFNNGEATDQPENYLPIDDEFTPVCSSADCTSVYSILLNVDKTVNPCDDFYKFACGNYAKTVELDDNVISGVAALAVTHYRLNQQLIRELKADSFTAELEAFRKMRMYYYNCLDVTEIEKIGTAPLLNLLKKFGGLPVLLGDEWNEEDYNWTEILSNISKQGFDPEFPVRLYINHDPTNSKIYSLHISFPVTNFDEATDEIFMTAYKLYLVEIAVLLGAKREKAIEEMSDCVEFEKKMYKAQSSQTDLRDFSPVNNKMTINELYNKNPDIPWLDIVNKILNPNNVSVTAEEFIIVSDPKFISEIGEIMENTPRRTIANYQIMRIVNELVEFMPEKFRNQKLALQKIKPPRYYPGRDQFCYASVKVAFGTALSSLYLKKYFNQQSKDKISVIIRNILHESEVVLRKVKWIDSKTRKEALRKLAAMKVVIAYPDELLDDQKIENIYENVQISPGKFFDNIQKMSSEIQKFKYKLLSQPVNDVIDVINVDAFNDYAKNKIYILAGMIQEPFYGLSRPQYTNYGSLGFIIGHEISHGFDTTGRKYDQNGNYRNWWTNQTASEFERKARCMIDQYNNYTIKQINQSVNGKLTIDENIADSAGIKLAYRAYQNSFENKEARKQFIPVQNYTLNQIFWISAASTWCGKFSNQALKMQIAVDVHSPGEARVNVPFSNTNDFAIDFNCPIGSRMNPLEKCEVW